MLGEKEASLSRRLKDVLKRGLGRPILGAALFGSAARGDETPHSDLDVCLLVERDDQKDKASDRAGCLFESVMQKFGLRLSPVVFTQKEFVRGYRKGNPLFQNIVQEGESLFGPDIKEIVRG